MNPYHRFLLSHRPYCEGDACCMSKPTHVIRVDGKDLVACEKHSINLSGSESQHGIRVLEPVAAPVTDSNSQEMAPAAQTFPTIAEQRAYWNDREQERMADESNGYLQWREEVDRRLPF